MSDGLTRAGTTDERADDRRESQSTTRGFLFADLRGYTEFTAAHGAASAASLLVRYRALVRGAIENFDGAEIRTEGDSFYVVFTSVSAAVRCGIAVTAEARDASTEHPEEPIRVGVGIHAGETIETQDGYVGAPVNIAARICSEAAAGELLVSDTVRALTQTLLPVRFAPRGRRRLKGVSEPVALYSVVPVAADEAVWGGAAPRSWWMKRPWLLVAAGGALALAVVAVGLFAVNNAGPALPAGLWRIGVTLPLGGGSGELTEGLKQAVELAVADANAAGGIGGAQLEIDLRNNVGSEENQEDEDTAAAHASALIDDPRVVAMVGPFLSHVARAQMPLTSEAGLLQCGPSGTAAGLTKPGAGALELRADSAKINYIRPIAVADIEARGAASFAVNDLGAMSALVIDDTDEFGRAAADAFEEAFTELGGGVIRRALNPGDDPAGVLEPLDDLEGSSLVFFGGFAFTGAVDVRKAMVGRGHGDVPFVSWEGVLDYTSDATYVDETGEAAIGTYASQPSVGTVRADFEDRLRAAYGSAPRGPVLSYVASAHVCMEVILETLRRVAEQRPSAEALREAVRAYAVDPAHRFQTVVGEVNFDMNGDNVHQFVTIYRVVAANLGDPGNWVIVKQLDFGSG
jgi:branched-chain amino acid transport system substrate-binding protein